MTRSPQAGQGMRRPPRQLAKSKAVNEFKEFAHRGHSLVLDSGWREIAEYSLDWLQSPQLHGRSLSAEASDDRFLDRVASPTENRAVLLRRGDASEI